MTGCARRSLHHTLPVLEIGQGLSFTMYRPLKRCKGQHRSAMIADFARNSDLYKLPELISLSAPEASVNTGKGVVVNYAPSTIAGEKQ